MPGASLWGRTPQAEWAQVWLCAHLEYAGLALVSFPSLSVRCAQCGTSVHMPHVPTLEQPPCPNFVPLPSLAHMMGHHQILSVSVSVRELVTLL